MGEEDLFDLDNTDKEVVGWEYASETVRIFYGSANHLGSKRNLGAELRVLYFAASQGSCNRVINQSF